MLWNNTVFYEYGLLLLVNEQTYWQIAEQNKVR